LWLSATALASPALAQHVPYGEDFTGKIGDTRASSTAAFPRRPEAPKGAPNVLLILIDDLGFAGTSTFGGAAQTPNFAKLAAEGVRYNRFH
ncbi:sulfatase-like hydrolase/transferase, partial [Salmonella enterica]|uniref:sulfatase-like hydrolase/transferase n=1 Tax=Salmonella enterica TaxID=28901 RepID=UPI003D27D8B3